MDDYKLDFGKLAYSKTEELSSRLTTLENTKQDTYNNISFSEKNIRFTSNYTKNDNFSAEKLTDLNLVYKLSGSGNFELTVYINDIFVYSQELILTAESSFEFEARGIETGTKELKTVFSGNGEISLTIAVSGNNINYSETSGNISAVKSGNNDYIFRLLENKLSLYLYNGTALSFICENFEKAFQCKILNYFDSGEYLLLFYTVWDGTLFYELYNLATNTGIKKDSIFQNVTAFSVCRQFDEIILFFISDGKCYFSSAYSLSDSLIFCQAVEQKIYNAEEIESAAKGGIIYLVYADSKQNTRLVYTAVNKNAEKENFSFSVSGSMEDDV